MASKPLTNTALYQRSDDSRPDSTARCDPEPRRTVIHATARGCQQYEEWRIQANALSRHPLVIASLAEAVAAPEALAAAIGHLLPVETESCLRPLARRRFKTARPACVRIRIRNPWVRRLLIRLG